MYSQNLPADEYFDIATKPTSNEMFDNGAWLAPILNSRDPEVDHRAKHAIHFYAEETRLSVCGNRFGPDHYVETFASPEETRKRCVGCTQILAAIQVGRGTSKLPTDTPTQETYTVVHFANLIQGSKRVRMRVNRMVQIEKTLYLLVDHGAVYARSLRRDLKRTLLTTDTVVLIWAGESPIERIQTERTQRVAQFREIQRLEQEFREMTAPTFKPNGPA